MRWSMRFIGLISTVILARLLDPFDFGIIAMAMVVIGLLETITAVGVDLALIQRQDVTEDHYNTAWTIQIIQGITVAGLLLAIAPFTEQYFNEPKLVLVVQILAIRALGQGFTNIGVVAFRKELDFAREFRFGVYRKLISFVTVVAAASILGNYWAVVIALVVSGGLWVLLSYLMHPYRPRLCLSKVRDIWSFSFWLLISRVGVYLSRKVDTMIIGSLSGTNAMGLYHIGSEVGMLFSQEFVMPMRRALFPNFATIANDEVRFRSTVLNMAGTVAIICFSTGLGVAAIAHDFTYVVLGEKWISAVPVIQWLSTFGAIAGIALSLEVVLLASGNARLSAIESWLQLLVLIPSIYYVAITCSLEEIAMSRLGVGLLLLPVTMLFVARTSPVSLGDILSVLWRPAMAGVAMYHAVRVLHAGPEVWAILRLTMDVTVGAVVYVSSLVLLWILAGRPQGVETTVLKKIAFNLR